MHLERVGAVSPPSRRRWTPRDCALYALALGAGWDELAFASDGVGESAQLVYPTFALSISAAESQSWSDPGFSTGDYEPHQLVLGSQSLELAPSTPHAATSQYARVSRASTTRARVRWYDSRSPRPTPAPARSRSSPASRCS